MFADILQTVYMSRGEQRGLRRAHKKACPTDIQQYLAEGDAAAITVRIPRNLRDAAKEAAAMRGIGFSTFVRMCVIEELKKEL